jgi:hypothetical protein
MRPRSRVREYLGTGAEAPIPRFPVSNLAGRDSDPVVAGRYRQQLRQLLQDASQYSRCLRKR